jgi:hypothetical protein
MITIHATLDAAISHLTVLGDHLEADLDQAIEAELAAFVARMEAVTPVRTGRMKAGYTVNQEGPGLFTVQDRQDYAGYVVYGTRRMRANPALRHLVDQEDLELELALEASLALAMGAP